MLVGVRAEHFQSQGCMILSISIINNINIDNILSIINNNYHYIL